MFFDIVTNTMLLRDNEFKLRILKPMMPLFQKCSQNQYYEILKLLDTDLPYKILFFFTNYDRSVNHTLSFSFRPRGDSVKIEFDKELYNIVKSDISELKLVKLELHSIHAIY